MAGKLQYHTIVFHFGIAVLHLEVSEVTRIVWILQLHTLIYLEVLHGNIHLTKVPMIV